MQNGFQGNNNGRDIERNRCTEEECMRPEHCHDVKRECYVKETHYKTDIIWKKERCGEKGCGCA